MSKRTPTISVLTANRLTDGLAVFLAADGTWVESIERAVVARSAEEAKALAAHGARDAARNLVVEPYLAEVAEAPDGLQPHRMRERVRVEGPSILADVPGYVGAPPPRKRGEGRGDGQPNAATPAASPAPFPANAGSADRHVAPVEA